METITNHHWRRFKYRDEVPPSILTEFDWLDESEEFDGFIHYHGTWHHISEFMRPVDPNHPANEWDGFMSYTYFSGVAIKLSDDGEQYQIATLMS